MSELDLRIIILNLILCKVVFVITFILIYVIEFFFLDKIRKLKKLVVEIEKEKEILVIRKL